jgi:hypothetical protein
MLASSYELTVSSQIGGDKPRVGWRLFRRTRSGKWGTASDGRVEHSAAMMRLKDTPLVTDASGAIELRLYYFVDRDLSLVLHENSQLLCTPADVL